MKVCKMKGGKKLCLNVNDLRAIAEVNKIALKLKEMEKLSKIRKDEKMNERNTKDDLMSQCRDENEIYDCGMCEYEFTDTCILRLEAIKKEKLERMKENEREKKRIYF